MKSYKLQSFFWKLFWYNWVLFRLINLLLIVCTFQVFRADGIYMLYFVLIYIYFVLPIISIINLFFVFLKPVKLFAILHIIPSVFGGLIVFWLFYVRNLKEMVFLIPILYSVIFILDFVIAYLFMKNRSAEL